MSIDTLKVVQGKEPVQIVEIYMLKCGRTYGVAPCTAAVGVTGTKKCFNTYGTCQDKANYVGQEVAHRFATRRMDFIEDYGYLLAEDGTFILQEDGSKIQLETRDTDALVFPTVKRVDSSPTVLDPGKGFGVRSRVTITLADHPWTESGGFDPSLASRSYDPDQQGSFWGKFLARQKFHRDRRIDVVTGYMENGVLDSASARRRTYLIESISGPSVNGEVTIVAKDPLRLADGDKTKFPMGYNISLLTAMTNVSTTVKVSFGADYATKLATWVAQNPDNLYIRVESEIVRVTGTATVPDGFGTQITTFTVVRQSMPAVYDFTVNLAVAHEVGSVVQLCQWWDNRHFTDILYTLLVATGIDLSFLPLAAWQARSDADGFQNVKFSTLIAEPVSIKDLITEITLHSILVWWDERAQVVQARALRFSSLVPATITDDVAIKDGSVSVGEMPLELATQVWIYFDERWPLADRKLVQSFRALDIRVDQDQEVAAAYGSASVREIRSRWLPRAQAGVAMSLGSTLLRQYNDIRRVISFEVDTKDDSIWVGDVIGISTRYVQDDEGANAEKNWLITQAEENLTGSGISVRYTAIEQFNLIRTGLITPNVMPDYTAASAAQKARYMFIAPNSGKFADGTNAYQIV